MGILVVHVSQVLFEVADVPEFPVAVLIGASVWFVLRVADIMLEVLAQTDLHLVAILKGALEYPWALFCLFFDEFVHYELSWIGHEVGDRFLLEHRIHVVSARNRLHQPARVQVELLYKFCRELLVTPLRLQLRKLVSSKYDLRLQVLLVELGQDWCRFLNLY